MKRIEFETYKIVDGYQLESLKKEEPSCINFLSYRKTKVIIEPIIESNEVYIKRLEKLLTKTNSHRISTMIENEIKKLKNV